MNEGEELPNVLANMSHTRIRLKDMGGDFPNESYQDTILRVLPKANDSVRQISQQSHKDIILRALPKANGFTHQTSQRDRVLSLTESRTTSKDVRRRVFVEVVGAVYTGMWRSEAGSVRQYP